MLRLLSTDHEAPDSIPNSAAGFFSSLVLFHVMKELVVHFPFLCSVLFSPQRKPLNFADPKGYPGRHIVSLLQYRSLYF